MFCVGKFLDRRGECVEVFPSKWLTGDGSCFWPPKDVQKRIRQQSDPDKTWKLSPIESVMGTYETFEDALVKAKIAETKSDLETDEEKELPRLRQRSFTPALDKKTSKPPKPRAILQPPVFPTLGLAEGSGIPRSSNSSDSEQDRCEFEEENNYEEGRSQFGNENELEENGNNGEWRRSLQYDEAKEICPELTGDTDNDIPFLLMEILKKTNANTVAVTSLVQGLSFVKIALGNLDRKFDLLGINNANASTTPDILPAPVPTLEEFITFDAELIGEKLTFLVNKLKRGGGSSVGDAVGRMMKKLITDEVATKISLKGLRENYKFCSTCAMKCITEACLSLPGISATERSVERAVGEWLRHAGDRVKASNKKNSNLG